MLGACSAKKSHIATEQWRSESKTSVRRGQLKEGKG